MALQRAWLVKVFEQDGVTPIKTIPGSNLAEKPSFSSHINGGFGECVLSLVGPQYRFDDFDEGNSVNFMNIIDIYAVNDAAPLGRRIYRGFISKYEPYLDAGGTEGVRVTCLGLVTLLTRSFYMNGSSYTVSHSGVDPAVIAKAVIDHFNTVYGGSLISYDGSSTTVSTVGASVSYEFSDTRWHDALTRVGSLAGEGWFWKVDENGKYWLSSKPETITHRFTIGKDIDSIDAPKTSEKVVNDLQIRRDGGLTSDYADAASQTAYGTGSPATGKASEIINDTGIGDENAADQRGNKEIADKKDAKTSATFTVNTKYDLESIKVGETCTVLNYNSASSFFPESMLIVGVAYDGDTCRVEVEEQASNLGQALASYVQSSGGGGSSSGGGGGGSGETNTGSNVGASGVGVFDGKSGVDLQFRKINAASSKITVTLNGQMVDIDVNEGALSTSSSFTRTYLHMGS